MSGTLYNIGMFIYHLGLHAASFWNSKAKARKEGITTRLRSDLLSIKNLSDKRILVHCASLGEYEQARPLVRRIIDRTDYDIVLSFYSPSGYEDCVIDSQRVQKCYLPSDRKSKIEAFIDNIRPSKVIIVKNEWWWNMLHYLRSKSIPTYLISATFREDHYFVKRPLAFFKDGLSAFSTIFTSNDESKTIARTIHDGQIIVSGDTRADQVRDNKAHSHDLRYRIPTIIYGSVWKSDLQVVQRIIKQNPNHRHVIYPHDLTKENVNNIVAKTNGLEVNDISIARDRIVYINSSMGQLKYDFNHADLAYIGGGFGAGIHNILEAAIYEIPVLFGPNHHKSIEAVKLIEAEAAFCIETPR